MATCAYPANPADIFSRGQNSQEFLGNSTWTQAPLWLSQNSDTWPQLSFHRQEVLEAKKPTNISVLIALHENITENEILRKLSTLKKLLSEVELRRIFDVGKR